MRLHYLEEGSGPPVVLLHGNGAMIEDFAISGVLRQLKTGAMLKVEEETNE